MSENSSMPSEHSSTSQPRSMTARTDGVDSSLHASSPEANSRHGWSAAMAVRYSRRVTGSSLIAVKNMR